MYLGIDIGTSSVKTVLFDRDQKLVGQASQGLSVSRPHPGWSEQDPEDWWRGRRGDDRRRSPASTGSPGLRGIGLSGQMHGAVCLDHDDRVLRPAILWNDGRAMAECAEIEAAFPRAREVAGNIAMPGFTAPKIAWLRKHEPEVFQHIDAVLLPKDYVRLRLTGHHVSEMSDAAGTFWLDVGARDWSDDLLEATGLSRSHMPRLVEGSAPSGELLPELARAVGRRRGRWWWPGGAGDNAAAACGVGVVTPGSAFVSIGTSGVLFVSNARLLAQHRRRGARLLPRDPGHLAPDGGDPLGVGQPRVAVADHRAQGGGARRRGRAGRGAVGRRPSCPISPASGRRTTTRPPAAPSSASPQSNDARDLTQAVLEGVAYAFADCQRVLKDAGTDFASALAVGGGARSDTWLAIIASVLDRPLEIAADSDVGAALGAARLAICAAEGADPAEVCAAPEILRVIEPDPALVPRYREGYARYRALYPALRAGA